MSHPRILPLLLALVEPNEAFRMRRQKRVYSVETAHNEFRAYKIDDDLHRHTGSKSHRSRRHTGLKNEEQ